MNAKALLDAIGEISDQHIIEFADVSTQKNKKNLYKRVVRIATIAASFIIIISLSFILSTLQHKDPSRNINMMTVSGRMYEIIDNQTQSVSFKKTINDILTKHGLNYPIDESSVGDKIGVFFADDGNPYTVFNYKPYKGQSVLVVKGEEQYQFALFCNLADNNTISMNDLLSLYGIDNAEMIHSVEVGGKKTSNKDITVFYKELSRSTVIGSYVDTDNIESVKITVKGDDSDVLTFDYYPERKLINCSLTFYQISDLLAYVLNQ